MRAELEVGGRGQFLSSLSLSLQIQTKSGFAPGVGDIAVPETDSACLPETFILNGWRKSIKTHIHEHTHACACTHTDTHTLNTAHHQGATHFRVVSG